MTKNPKTVSKDIMASEAMKIMHDKKITNIFVIEDKKPIGVIHIHDLLNNGVAQKVDYAELVSASQIYLIKIHIKPVGVFPA